MPSFNRSKVEYISSINQVTYPGPYMVVTDGEPSAEEVCNFNGKIYVLRGAATEQDFKAIADKLDDRYAQSNPGFAAYLKERRAKEAREKINHSKKEEVKGAVEPKIEPHPVESGDHAPNACESDNEFESVHTFNETGENVVAEIVHKLSSADFDPEVPNRAVVLQGKFYLLHRDAKAQDITELAEKLNELMVSMREHPPGSELIDASLGLAVDKLSSMASWTTESEELVKGLHEDIPLKETFLCVIRCNVKTTKEKVKSNERRGVGYPKNVTQVAAVFGRLPPRRSEVAEVEPKAVSRASVEDEKQEKATAAGLARLMGRDARGDRMLPDRGVILDDIFYMLHKDAKTEDIAALAEKLAIIQISGRDFDQINDVKRQAHEALNSIARPIDPPNRMGGDIGVMRFKYEEPVKDVVEPTPVEPNEESNDNKKEVEPNVESNEDDEYEEVGIFSDIKCKCVIS